MSCASSSTMTASGATRSGCSSTAIRSPRIADRRWPPSSASARRCSSRIETAHAYASTRPRWSCRSPAIRPSAPPGYWPTKDTPLMPCLPWPARSRCDTPATQPTWRRSPSGRHRSSFASWAPRQSSAASTPLQPRSTRTPGPGSTRRRERCERARSCRRRASPRTRPPARLRSASARD
jgi:hypothetical protein